MDKLTVAEARKADAVGRTVRLQGWVRTRRDSKGGFSFIELNDGSCQGNVQIVAPGELPNYESVVKHLHTGASVAIDGEVKASPAKGQATEVLASAVELLGDANPELYPLQKKGHTFEFLRTIAHLRPRTNTFGAIARLRNQVSKSIHDFFYEQGFLYIHTPIITASDCEGGGAALPRHHPRPRQAPQGRWQRPTTRRTSSTSRRSSPSAVSCRWKRSPARWARSTPSAPPSAPRTRIRRATSPSSGWSNRKWPSTTSTDNMTLAEAFLKRIIRDALERCPEDMKFFQERIDKELLGRLENVLDNPFKRVPYTEAVDILLKSGKTWTFPVAWGSDLQSEHERYLAEEHFKCPVILYDYPRTLKPFYMRVNDDGKTVRAMDVLVPGVGEIIGGSQREERLDVLEQRMREQGLEPEAYNWYLDLRRYGTVPHSGFGLGLERTILFLSGMANIRDVIPFPRTPGNAEY